MTVFSHCFKYHAANLVLAFSIAVLSSGIVRAQDLPAAQVVFLPAGVDILLPDDAVVTSIWVRIVGPNGRVLEEVAQDGFVTWSPSDRDVDGAYRYEVVVNDDVNGRSARSSGTFTVHNGIVEGPAEEGEDQAGLWKGVTQILATMGREVLNILVPAAHAVDVNVSSGIPRVFFDDTDIVATTNEWTIGARESGGSRFEVNDLINSTFPFFIQNSANNANSFTVDSAGDVRLANSTLNIDRSASFVGVGTTAPSFPLEVSGSQNAALIKGTNTSGTAVLRSVLSISNFGPPSFAILDTSTSPGTDWLFRSSGTGAFAIAAVGFPTAFRLTPNGSLTINGTLAQGSSRESKTDISVVVARDILDEVVNLPIATWRYKTSEESDMHIGPMAEDFYSRFGLGVSQTKLAPGDVSGVALAAIKGLHEVIDEKDQQIAALEDRLAKLEQVVSVLAGTPSQDAVASAVE